MDDIRNGINLILVHLKEASSKIRRSMSSSLEYLQSKHISELNSTSEQEAFSEKDKEDAMKPVSYQESVETMENWDYNIHEIMLNYRKLDTDESQHHRDPALSDPQETVGADQLLHGRKHLLLFAVLAASVTYQAGLSPPGGLWQENMADHVFGNAVPNDNHRCRMAFFYCNATAFVSSLVIIVLLVSRKVFARGIQSNVLSACVILELIGLTGAFVAVNSRRVSTSIYVFILVFAVLVCIMLHVLVRVGSGSLAETSVLGHKNEDMKWKPEKGRKHLPPFATLAAIVTYYEARVSQGSFGQVYTAVNCSESADPAVDDEDDRANRPIKRNNPREATWRVACAAPHHMTGNRSLLLTDGYMPVLDSNDGEVVLVNLADNKQAVPLRVSGSGSVRTESIALDDVWYVPGLDSNLVSTGQLARQGCAVNLGPGGCRITRDGSALVGTARFTEACQFELDFLKVAASSM